MTPAEAIVKRCLAKETRIFDTSISAQTCLARLMR